MPRLKCLRARVAPLGAAGHVHTGVGLRSSPCCGFGACRGAGRCRGASLGFAPPVARTGGCAPPAGVRVQLPRPAAGHPWPAGSTPPGARDGPGHPPAPVRASTAVGRASPATGTRGRSQSRRGGQQRQREVVDCHDGLRSSPLTSGRDDGSVPAVDAGGCPEPAMDGRRPDVGAGRGDIRLGIPLWPRRAAAPQPAVPWLWLGRELQDPRLRARMEIPQWGEQPSSCLRSALARDGSRRAASRVSAPNGSQPGV